MQRLNQPTDWSSNRPIKTNLLPHKQLNRVWLLPDQYRIPLVVAELIHTQLFVERKFHIPSIGPDLCYGRYFLR